MTYHTSRDFSPMQASLPDWVIYAEATCALDDIWMEETDPENELGEACEGFFSILDTDSDYTAILNGIAVTDTSGTAYYDRARAADFLGIEIIHRIERVFTDELIEQGGDTPLCVAAERAHIASERLGWGEV